MHEAFDLQSAEAIRPEGRRLMYDVVWAVWLMADVWDVWDVEWF